MQITFLARKSALIYRRGLRQRVASLTLDFNGVFAIRACFGLALHLEGLLVDIQIRRIVGQCYIAYSAANAGQLSMTSLQEQGFSCRLSSYQPISTLIAHNLW